MLLVLLACPWGIGRGGELVCAPSAAGCITTWLVAGPMKFLRDADFDRDFLKDVGGEAAARPRDGDVADAAGGSTWHAGIFPGSVLDLADRCLPLGNSAFYLAAALVPRKDLEATLVVTHTGTARAWVDGKAAIRSDKDPFALGPQTAEHKLSLRAGRPVHCLLKLGSDGRYLQFFVRLKEGRRAVGPDEVAVALAFPADVAPAADSYVLSSLSVGLGRERFVQPGRRSDLVFGVEGGHPVCDGEVAATITVRDSRGRTVETFKTPPAGLAALAARRVLLPWTPPEDARSAFFELLAQVSFKGRDLGALSKTVYSPSDIGHWTADLHQRLGALSKAGKLPQDALAQVLLKVEKAISLQQGGDLRVFAPDKVCRELELASSWLARLEKGKGLPAPEPGVHELAYLAEQDDSPQPYYLHIPRTYTGRKPLPAIVYLHGYAPWLDKTNWHSLSYGLTDQAEEHGYAIICPFARSNTDFQGIGEVDVLHVLRLAQQQVKIDPDRIFLVGYSMGGMGAYTIAAHAPDLWAGVVVLCGRADYWLWKDLDPARVEPFKRHLLDMEFGWPLAGNFRHLAVLAYQGTFDVLIKPEQAYRFVDRLKQLGTPATLVRLEGQSHWIADETFSTPGAFDWMARQRRVAAPRTIRFETYSLLYPRAWWATIGAFTQWGKPASFEATLDAGNRLTLTSENVARLTLAPPPALCKPDAPFQATVNGQARTLRAHDGTLTIGLGGLPEGPLRKTPTLCGPIKDAFNRRFLLVYGTTGGEAATKRNQALAERVQGEWQRFAKGLRKAIPDTALAETDIARSNLFLFGTPSDHALLARIADKLPVKFTDAGYEVLGRTYKADERTGLMFLYPNPLAPDRYVVVSCGTPYGEKLGENHKLDLLPDFIVYSDEPDYDDTNAFYCAGFFDTAWQLDPKLTWTSDGRPKPKPAAAQPPAPERQPAPAVP